MAHRPDSLVIRSRVEERKQYKKDLFIHALKRLHNVSVVCEVLGIGVTTVYDWRYEDADFAERWDLAVQYSKEAFESATYVKLSKSLTNERLRLSMPEAKLIELLLSGMFPEKYRQRVDLNTVVEVTIEWAKLPDEVIDRYLAKELTLDDVYQISLQQTTRGDSTRTSDQGASEERASETIESESNDQST